MYKERLEQEIASAMKSGDEISLSVWRDIKNEFMVYEKASSQNKINDSVELKIIGKMASSRKESMEIFLKAGRNDLAENEKKEMEVLNTLLPKEPTEDEIKDEVLKILSTIESPSMKNLKDVISGIKKKYPTANGGVISKIFRENINN